MKMLFLTLALTAAAAVPASAQTTSLTLVCTDAVAPGNPDEVTPPMGIVVGDGKVSFGDWGSVPILQVTPTSVSFHGVGQSVTAGVLARWDIDGSIDRISGDTLAQVSMSGVKNPQVTSFHLTCKPAQRLF